MKKIKFKSDNFVFVVQTRASELPDQLAYTFLAENDEPLSIHYAELDKKARAIAGHLQQQSIFSKRVLVLYSPGVEFITAFLGCLYAGAIAVPVSAPRLAEFEKSADRLKAIAIDADVQCVLTESYYVEKVETYFADLFNTKNISLVDSELIKTTASSLYQPPQIEEDTVAYLQYTSGSTSVPKGVVTTHLNLAHSLKFTAHVWHYSKKSVTLTWAPHSHVYGLVCGLLLPLYHGTPSYILAPDTFIRRPATWLEAISTYQVTHSGCPNFGYNLCVQEVDVTQLNNLNLKKWVVAINGGESVQRQTLQKFTQKFAVFGFKPNHFNSAFGMSEATGLIAATHYDSTPDTFDLALEGLKINKVNVASQKTPHLTFVSCGEALPGLDIAIVNPDTLLPVNEDEIGEIWLAGDSIATGYFRRPIENKAAFGLRLPGSENLYFRTGDLGFIRESKLCITGRLKEMIVIHGKKYYPFDIESTVSSALAALPVNLYRAAFSTYINGNEEVIFLQEVKEGISENTKNEIIHLARKAVLERFGIDLHAVILVKANSLPKTPSGKLQHKKCHEFYDNQKLDIVKLHSHHPKPTKKLQQAITKHPDQYGEIIRFQAEFLKLVSSVLKIDATQIHLSDPISTYHFDSINLIQLTNVFNEKFNLTLTPATLFEFTTLEAFFDSLLSQNRHAIIHYYQTAQTDNVKPTTPNKNEIAIVGMSGILPGAANVEIFWQNLVEGRDVISEVPKERWDWEKYFGQADTDNNKTPVKWGGFIEDISQFDANFFHISPREAEVIDPQQRLFLQTAWSAIEDAGLSTTVLSKLKTGLFVGAFSNDYAELLHQHGVTDAYTTTGLIHSILANRVSYLLNLHGPSVVIDTACSSSLVALHQAVQAIQNGDCDVVIVGGVNALVTPTSYLSASKAGMLSEDGRCKTFDSQANGYVRSEGVAALVLMPLAEAEKVGAHIYGVIKGTAVNHGGNVSSLTVPNPNAQAEVIVTACKRAGIKPQTLSYIETHGTGTSLGDPIEINGLKKAFAQFNDAASLDEENPTYCGLGAVKSNIGHLESAAGIASVIKVLLAMKYQQIPGNLHFEKLNPYIELENSPFYIVNKTKKWNRLQDFNGKEIPNRAGISSFGFGGTNAHVIIEEYTAKSTTTDDDSHPYLIALSAKTPIALTQKLKDLKNWLANQEVLPSLSALSFTLNEGRNHFAIRSAFVVESIDELQKSIGKVLSNEITNNYIFQDEAGTSEPRRLSKSEFKQLIDSIDSKISSTEYKAKLSDLAVYYTQGFDIPWQKLLFTTRSRIALPSYPFAKEHYWIDIQNPAAAVSQPTQTKTSPQLMLSGNAIDFIQEDFIQHASKLLKLLPAQMNLDVSLTELGFDSIALKELAVKLEKHYSIQLTPSVFFTHKSIKAISHYLLENYPTEIMRVYAPVEAAWVDKLAETDLSDRNNVSQTNESIAIIGMQGYLPQSNNVSELWEHLIAGDDLVTEVPPSRWDWHQYYGDAKQDTRKTNSKWAGLIRDVDKFDASFFKISAREANLMDPQQRLLLEVVWKTMEDAGYDPTAFSNKSVGVFVGVEFSEYENLIHAHANIFHGHVATGTSHAMLANRISYFLNLHGPSEVIDTACSSSLVAVNRAAKALQNGECHVAIAGGVSLILDPDTFVITSQLGALSPDGRCKTFDKSANGYVKGEGVVALLLKPFSQAEADGDPIYGVIKATSVNHGGKAQSLTAPDAASQSRLLVKAYTQSGIDPRTVTYIETHGTGTDLGDPIEIEGLKQAFKTLLSQKKSDPVQTNYCGIGSVKTNMGHLEPASGIAGMIKVLLAMKYGRIPGNLHFNELNPFIDLSDSPFYIVNKTQEWPHLKDHKLNDIPRRAGVSSFGFGGTNAHVVLEESMQPTITKKAHKPYYLITLSAKTPESLQQKTQDLYNWLKQNFSKTAIEAFSFTLNTGRTHFEARSAIVVNSLDELLQTLQSILDGTPAKNYLINTKAVNYEGFVFDEVYKAVMVFLEKYTGDTPQIYREKLLLLADLYTKHYPIDFVKLHVGESQQRIASLPTYPFIKLHYWFDAESTETKPSTLPQLIKTESIKTGMNFAAFTQTYLKNLFAEKLKINPDQISIDETYEVYGVDSVLGLEITNRLESDFGTLSKTLLYERSKISDLALYLQQKFHDKLQQLYKQQTGDEVPVTQSKESPVINTRPLTPVEKSDVGDIAIIGLSGVYPMAKNIQAFWENLVAGKDCVGEVPSERWDYKEYPVKIGEEVKYFKAGGFIPDVDKFDPLFFSIAPRDAALMDPQERLFMQTCWATLEDAGYTRETLQKTVNNEVGIFAGVTYNFYPLFIYEEWQKGNRIPLDVQSFSIANRISYFLNVNGPSFVVDTACSSSLAAIHLACESIARGECKMAIAGGVNLSLHPAKYHMLGSYSFMSDEGRCASFAEGGAGYVPSEGVGAVLLKPLAQAISDKDRIYGVIKSSSMNHGGKTSGYTVPNPNAQADLIKQALKRGQIDPRSISYIEAHGTGTSLGDPIEIRGLQEAFEEHTSDKQFCAIGSVKSNIGHLESAAGISQLTKVLLQLQHKKLVPTLHAEKLNPFIDFAQSPFYVQRELTDWSPKAGFPRRAGISSFGAGGTNVHVIVEEYVSPSTSKQERIKPPFLFVFSAFNAERLQEYAKEMSDYFNGQKAQPAADLATLKKLSDWSYTLQAGREAMSARLALIAHSIDDLTTKLNAFVSDAKKEISELWFNPAVRSSQSVSRPADLASTAQLWVNGGKISWQDWYEGESPERVYLPTYPFAKRRCWVPTTSITSEPVVPMTVSTTQATKNETVVTAPEKPIVTPKNDVVDWFYQTNWQPKPLEDVNVIKNTNDRWLIFSDKELGLLLQQELGVNACLYNFMSEAFDELNSNAFYMNPDRPDDYNQLFARVLAEQGTNIKGVIYLWPTADEAPQIEASFKLLCTFQALMKQQWQTKLQFCLVTRSVQSVTEDKPIDVCQRDLWSMTRIFGAEQPNFQVQLLDLDPVKNLRHDAKQIANEVLQLHHNDNHIAYRNNIRFVAAPRKTVSEPLGRDHVTALLFNAAAKMLNLDVTELELDVPFQNYGMDSIIGIQFIAEMNAHFPDAISPMDLYRYPTLGQLAGYLMEKNDSEEVPTVTVKIESVDVPDENEFFEKMSHLNDEQVRKLLDDELSTLDKWQ